MNCFKPERETQLILFLEGGIGAGKTTLLKQISEHYPYVLCKRERIEDWEGILEKKYNGKTNQDFPLQIACLLSNLRRPARKNGITIFERSWISSLAIFGLQSFHNGKITKDEYQLLKDMIDQMEVIIPDAILHLTTSAELSYRQTKVRNRASEREMSKEFVKDIHGRNNRFFQSINQAGLIPVIPVSHGDFTTWWKEIEKLPNMQRKNKLSIKHEILNLLP